MATGRFARQRWLRTLVVSLTAMTSATLAFASAVDETDRNLGRLNAPQGGRAYRVAWDGSSSGFVQATVNADGRVQLQRGQRGQATVTVLLRPGDLAAFEQDLARSPFAATPPHYASRRCLDECSDHFLTVVTDAGRKTLPVEPRILTAEEAQSGRRSSAPDLGDVADELIQIADARTGELRGRPGPWWTRDGMARPYPEASGASCAPEAPRCAEDRWKARLRALGLAELSAPPFEQPRKSLYRLLWFSPGAPAEAALVTVEASACGVVSRPSPTCEARAWIRTTARSKPRPIPVSSLRGFEAALYGAGFSTLANESGSPCPTGAVWVLEAYLEHRYRYVAGSTCDPRGLDLPVAQLRRWARWRKTPGRR